MGWWWRIVTYLASQKMHPWSALPAWHDGQRGTATWPTQATSADRACHTLTQQLTSNSGWHGLHGNVCGAQKQPLRNSDGELFISERLAVQVLLYSRCFPAVLNIRHELLESGCSPGQVHKPSLTPNKAGCQWLGITSMKRTDCQ